MAAEAEGVAHSDIDLCLSGFERNEVYLKVATLILVFEVDGGGDDRFVYDFYADNKLDRGAGSKLMSKAALC